MIHLEINVPADRVEAVLDLLDGDETVSSISRIRGGSLKPVGDLIEVDVAREAAQSLLDALRQLGLGGTGCVRIEEVSTFLSKNALDAEKRAPGFGSDAVVWASVGRRAYNDSELSFSYLTFMCLATILAAIAIVLDSPILTVGAMVLGPEFGAIAALGVGLVLRRWRLLVFSIRTLLIGFAVAIVVTFGLSLLARGLGWVSVDNLALHPATAFIYSPDKWSFIVALLAAAAGVLSITSAREGGLSGVFISVTTIPAAGYIGLASAFGMWAEVRGSALQLLINITGMALAGWLTLLTQQAVWAPIVQRAARRRAARQKFRSRSQ